MRHNKEIWKFEVLQVCIFLLTYTIILFPIKLFFKCEITIELRIILVMASFFIADVICFKRRYKMGVELEGYSYNNCFSGLCQKYRQIAIWKIYLFGLLWNSAASAFLFFIDKDLQNPLENASKSQIIIIGLVIAPLFETFIAQLAPVIIVHKITSKITKRRYPVFSIIVSAAIFATMHGYSIEYLLFAFWIGLYFAFVFVYEYETHDHKIGYAFIVTAGLHLLHNTFPFISTMIN